MPGPSTDVLTGSERLANNIDKLRMPGERVERTAAIQVTIAADPGVVAMVAFAESCSKAPMPVAVSTQMVKTARAALRAWVKGVRDG